jgi:hypothetical protein
MLRFLNLSAMHQFVNDHFLDNQGHRQFQANNARQNLTLTTRAMQRPDKLANLADYKPNSPRIPRVIMDPRLMELDGAALDGDSASMTP